MATAIPPDVYQIEIQGHLDESWSDWFNGLTIGAGTTGTTTLTGPVADQAALQGILLRIWSLNLVLLSVNRVSLTRGTTSDR
jgi:hypothetical protein